MIRCTIFSCISLHYFFSAPDPKYCRDRAPKGVGKEALRYLTALPATPGTSGLCESHRLDPAKPIWAK